MLFYSLQLLQRIFELLAKNDRMKDKLCCYSFKDFDKNWIKRKLSKLLKTIGYKRMKKKRLTIMYLKIRVLELFCLREHLSEVTLDRLFKNLNSLN